MDEMHECLTKANAQIELVRVWYFKNKDNKMFETEYGKRFIEHLALSIKNVGLAELCLGIMTLEEQIREGLQEE